MPGTRPNCEAHNYALSPIATLNACRTVPAGTIGLSACMCSSCGRTGTSLHVCTQEKPQLWAQILEASEAQDDEVEHFMDAPALDKDTSTSEARLEASAGKAVSAEAAAADKQPGQAAVVTPKSTNGYDIAKR